MKKYLLLGLIAFACWDYYLRKHSDPVSIDEKVAGGVDTLQNSNPEPVRETQTFQCDGRVDCSDMHSRAEAEFFVKHCPGIKMDGDNDGEPCENDSRF